MQKGDPEHCDCAGLDGFCIRIRVSNALPGNHDVGVHVHSKDDLEGALAEVSNAILARVMG